MPSPRGTIKFQFYNKLKHPGKVKGLFRLCCVFTSRRSSPLHFGRFMIVFPQALSRLQHRAVLFPCLFSRTIFNWSPGAACLCVWPSLFSAEWEVGCWLITFWTYSEFRFFLLVICLRCSAAQVIYSWVEWRVTYSWFTDETAVNDRSYISVSCYRTCPMHNTCISDTPIIS